MIATTSETSVSLRPSGEFIEERKYLLNVSPKTIIFYQCSFKAFEGALEFEAAKRRVVQLRQRGVKSVSVNTDLTCINAYWKWNGLNWRLSPLKEEQKILQTLSDNHIKALLGFRPVGVNLKRAHLIALTILDTGLRASEVLGLTFKDCDLDNLTFKVKGKGNKHRLVPFSAELQKALWRMFRSAEENRNYIFATKNNTIVSIRNIERDFKILAKRVGITDVRFSPHTLRHTFAVSYLRNGGNLEYLRRILGHSNLSTTPEVPEESRYRINTGSPSHV